VKKYIIATFVALAVFASAAFAASLTVDAGTLQAGEAAIDQCIEGADEAVAVSYGAATFDHDMGIWTIDSITLDHDGQCDGLAYSVVVTGDGDGLPTATATGTFDGDPELVTFSSGFDAEGASDVHLVIRTATPTP
jgi:hypothetical protein